MAKKAKSVEIKDRIVGFGRKKASQFTLNPLNWRTHPESQRAAVAGSLHSIGWVKPVIENVRTGYLIDGHERIWYALDQGDIEVPFIAVDVSEEEEKSAIVVLDVITEMAGTDREKLTDLLSQITADDVRMQDLLSSIAERKALLELTSFDASQVEGAVIGESLTSIVIHLAFRNETAARTAYVRLTGKNPATPTPRNMFVDGDEVEWARSENQTDES